MLARLLPVLCLLLLAGCAGQSIPVRSGGQDGLEPEITGLDALRNSRGRPLTAAERQVLASRPEMHFKLSEDDSRDEALFFEYFTHEKRATMQRWMQHGEPHLEYVRAVLASHGLPQDLIALPFIESGYNVQAVSSSGAGGMWQFMPATAKRFGLTVDWWLDERRDPYLSTVAAARYLKGLHQQFGDWQLALAAYNAGEGSISRAMASTGKQSFKSLAQNGPLREETKHYVPKFLAALKIFKNAKRLGFIAPSIRASKDLAEVRIPGGSDLAGLASTLGLTWEQFHALNPAYRRQVSPPDRATAAWVPKPLAGTATAWLERAKYGKSGQAVRLAKAGDTWWNLARETGLPVNALRLANNGQDKPIPGHAVLIPLPACAQDAVQCDPQAVPVRAVAQAQAQPQSKGQVLTPAGQPSLYIVHHGDSLASVAKHTGVSIEELASLNKANPKDALTPGTPLLIPARPAQAQAQARGPLPAQPAQAGKIHEFKIAKRTSY